jgi:predicted Zn-dependent peptidase
MKSASSLEILTETLPNGLVVVGERNPVSRSAALGYFVKTGARDEIGVESGVSHFLEHMLFKGSSRFDAIGLSLELARLGVQANAYTSEESTVYYGAVISEHLAEYHGVLSDMMRPTLDEKEFSLEKNVILEEIALYQDRPQFYLMDQALSHYYRGHPAGNSVLGSNASISALTCEQMRSYFNRRYTPQNIVFGIAGEFDWDEILTLTEKATRHWESFAASRTVEPYQGEKLEHTFTKPNLEQAYLFMVREGCSCIDTDRYALNLLALLVGDSGNSPLYWNITHEGLAEDVMVATDERDGTGLVMAYAVSGISQLDTVRERMEEVFTAEHFWTEADLQRVKLKHISQIVLSGEVPMSRVMAIGNGMLAQGEAISLSERIRRIESVSLGDISRVAKRFPFTNWSEYRLIPA